MAGIEDILGHHGNHHLRDRYLLNIFQALIKLHTIAPFVRFCTAHRRQNIHHYFFVADSNDSITSLLDLICSEITKAPNQRS